MSHKSSVFICARWLGTALRPSTASLTAEAVDPLRSRLLLLDSLKPEDLTATLADGRLLRRLQRRLLRSRRISSLLSDGYEVETDADSGVDRDGNDNDDDGEEAVQRRVSQFLESCRTEFHLPDEYLFQPSDLLPQPGGAGNPERVLRCLQALSQSDSVAAAGFANDAFLPASIDDVALSVDEENYSTLDDYSSVRWDAPVLDVLDELIVFFRASCTLARQLRESPLSVWPADAVDALFGRSPDSLEILASLRASLRSNEEQLDEALVKREAQLVKLYSGLWWNMILVGNRKLKELNKSCLDQVTLAVRKLPQAVESAAKCAMDLQQMPKNHLRRLMAAVEKAMEPVKETNEARQRLQASLELLKRVEERVNHCLGNAKKHLEPSCAEFDKLNWPPRLLFWATKGPTKLGRLRHSGSLLGPDGKRLHASLWDGALVLSQSGEVLHALPIGPDAKFEEVSGGGGGGGGGKAFALSKRGASFRIIVGGSSEEALTLGCDSVADREVWQKAFSRAHGVWSPAGFNQHGHWFSRTATSPDFRPPPDCCKHCDKLLGCWAHRCERCRVWLHKRCVTAACCPSNTQQVHISCRPVAPPRRSKQYATSIQKNQKPPVAQETQSWSEPTPVDAKTARVRLRQLPELKPGRRRNFLLCPTATVTQTSNSDSDAYQLHVLAGEAVFTYQVESVSEEKLLRIAGASNSFPDLKDLVRHYESNPLPPPQPDDCVEEDDIYEPIELVPERLVLDSGVADC
ncbi:hypothetical protein BOX15_Mlig026032g2 [Macrostomum lignano]|uniref:Phorbol-ester/DAG-type domain-containing protein n=2 Tax=Macrostomum lignano TaxID=282301 RepID=A0A1I8HBF4_9PLAT|nr:hypothetical protein BOX15_Mlig026032g2 [Macrostomum lignano]